MVKIIGFDESVVAVMRKNCKDCGAILEYTQRDIKVRNGVDYSGGPDGMEWIDCPNCDSKVVLRAW